MIFFSFSHLTSYSKYYIIVPSFGEVVESEVKQKLKKQLAHNTHYAQKERRKTMAVKKQVQTETEMPWRFLLYREPEKRNLIYNAVFSQYHEGRLIIELAEDVFNLPPDCWRVVSVDS